MMTFLTRNPWTFINDNREWATSHELRTLVRDFYQMMFSIGLGLIACSILILFLKWGTKNYSNHGMGRRLGLIWPLLFKLGCVTVLTCLPYLLGEIWRIFNTIAKAATG